jgi:N-carbamoylputrescine amidase
MALGGAEMLLYPTAIGNEPQYPTLDSRDHWQRVMQGHAAANMVPVAASNRIGTEKHEAATMTFYGSSFIADQTGGKAVEAPRDAGGVFTASFDLDAIAEQRRLWGLFRDRRPDLYGRLVEPGLRPDLRQD